MNGQRLVSWWWLAGALGLLGAMVAGFLVVLLVSTGFDRVIAGLLLLMSSSFLASVLATLAVRRRRRPLPTSADGTVVISSPAVAAAGLLVAWLAALVLAAVWAVIAVVDFDRIEAPGFTIVLWVGALATLPDLVRLLTGRLHRWRVLIGPDGVTYRGYRTDETVPWAGLKRVTVSERKPAGVVLDRRGGGPDPVIPAAAFTVPAEQIAEEIRNRLVRRG